MQKPIFASMISTAGLDDTNKVPKDYYCIISEKDVMPGQPREGTMLFIRAGRNKLAKKHHRTVFALDASTAFKLSQMKEEAEIELILKKGNDYQVPSLSIHNTYTMDGRFVIGPAQNAVDKSMRAMCSALLQAGANTPLRFLTETLVTEDKVLESLASLLARVKDGVQKQNVDGTKLSSLFYLVEETITTEVKYLASYDRFQVSMKQLEIFLSCLGDAEMASFEARFRDIMQDVDKASSAARNALEKLSQGLQDIDFIVGDDSQKVIRLCQLISESASNMHRAEEDLLLKTHEAFFLLKEMQENSSFQEFAVSLELTSDNKKIIDFLGSSMQRVTRRPLLLENLCKHLRGLNCFTAKQLGDLEDLLAQERDRTNEMNRNIKRAELDTDVIARQLRPAININEPGRECLLKARVRSCAGQSAGMDKLPVVMFVFNDSILVTKPSNVAEQFLFSGCYSMRDAKVAFDSVAKTMTIGAEEFDLAGEFDEVHKAVQQAQSVAQTTADIRMPQKEQRLSALFLAKIGVRSATPNKRSTPSGGSFRSTPLTRSSSVGGLPERNGTPSSSLRPASPSRFTERSATPTRGAGSGRNLLPIGLASSTKQVIRAPSPGAPTPMVAGTPRAASRTGIPESALRSQNSAPNVLGVASSRKLTMDGPVRAPSPLRQSTMGNYSRASPQVKKPTLYDASRSAVELAGATPGRVRSISRENQAPMS